MPSPKIKTNSAHGQHSPARSFCCTAPAASAWMHVCSGGAAAASGSAGDLRGGGRRSTNAQRMAPLGNNHQQVYEAGAASSYNMHYNGGTQQLTSCCPCCRGQPAVLLETTKADGQPGCRLNCDMYKFTYTDHITHHGALVDSKLVCWPGHEHTRLAKTQKRNARGSAAEGLLQMSTTS